MTLTPRQLLAAAAADRIDEHETAIRLHRELRLQLKTTSIKPRLLAEALAQARRDHAEAGAHLARVLAVVEGEEQDDE